MKRIIQLLTFLLLLVASEHMSAQSTNYQWKPVTMGGGGWVTGLVAHPGQQNLVYARTDVGGLYKWLPATNSWEQLITLDAMPADFLSYQENLGENIYRVNVYEVQSVGIDPNNVNTIYISSGGKMDQEGIFMKSTNGGQSWDWKPGLNIPMVGNEGDRQFMERITVDPLNANVVYYGSKKDGLWISDDGGENWTQTPTSQIPLGTKIFVPSSGTSPYIGTQQIICDPSQGTASNGRSAVLYAAVGGYGIYKSTNGGQSWLRVWDFPTTEGLPTNKFFTDLEYVNGKMYFSGKDIRVHSFDGTTVTQTALSNTKIFDVAVDPQNKDIIYAATNGMGNIWRSTNGGAQWNQLPQTSKTTAGREYFKSSLAPWKENSDVRGFLSVGELRIDPFDSDRMWFAEGMGVWKADNIQGNDTFIFNDVSEGIEEMVATDVAVSDSYVTFMVWDRIGFTKSKSQLDVIPSQQTLNTVSFSTGTSVDIAPDGQFMAAVASDHRGCCGNGDFSGYSEDGGVNWTRFGSIVPGSEPRFDTNNPAALEYGELVVSADDNNNMVWISRRLGNTTEIYYTIDKGDSWTKATQNGWNNKGWQFLTSKKALTRDAVSGGTFYAMDWNVGKIYKSTDKGVTWNATPATIPKEVWHGQLKPAPGKQGHLWMATGYDHRRPVADRGMWRSTDGAATMNKLANVQDAWAIGFGKEFTTGGYPTIFIYGKINNVWGVYRSVDEAASWQMIATYPNGIFDRVATIEGDPSIFGRVYMGYQGNTFVYGSVTSANQPVTAVVIQSENVTILEGATSAMSAVVLPFDATNQNITWSVNNPSIASIDAIGNITGLAAGTVQVTATSNNGKTDITNVTVEPVVAVQNVSFSQSTLSIAYDEKQQALATVSPANATFKQITYTSSDVSVATVSATGSIYGVALGQATITANDASGTKSDQLVVTVTAPPNDTWIAIDHESKPVGVGYASGITPVLFTPSGNNTVAVVSNPSPSGINTSASVTKFDKSAGTFQLFLYDFQGSGREISTFDELTIKAYGQISSIYVQIKDSNDAIIFEETQNVSINNSWTSVDFSISTAGATGIADVIAIYIDPNAAVVKSYYVDDIGFKFNTTNRPLLGITLNPSNLSVEEGSTSQIGVTYNPVNASNKNLTWESLNTSIASVSANGIVTGIAEGTATIRATAADGGYVQTATVTVFKNEFTATKSTVTIDGNLESAWNLSNTASKVVSGSGYNNTSTFGVLWDDNYLYIAASVQDNSLFNDSSNPWEDDGIEIYIDGNNDKGGTYDLNDLQVIKEYSGTDLFTSRTVTGVLHANQTISGGYTIEVAIPWSALDNLSVGEGTEIGFSLGVNDDDNGTNRESQVVWAGTSSNYNNTNGFGVVILGAPSGGGTVPAQPSALSASATGTSSISITWADNSNNEDGFRLQRRTGSGSYAQIATPSANATSFNDTGLSANTTYEYRIQSFNTIGSSSFTSSASATTNSNPPSGSLKLEAEDQTNTDASPSTTHPGFEGTGFMDYGSYVQFDNVSVGTAGSYDIVLRYANNSGGNRNVELIANGGSPITVALPDVFSSWAEWGTATASGVSLNASGNTIRIQNAPGFSGPNLDNIEIVGATAGPTAPDAPSALAATSTGTTSIDLSWSDNSSDEDGFYVERKQGTGSYTQIASLSAGTQTYSDSGLSASTTYTYQVKAYNSGGSNTSNEASATTDDLPSGGGFVQDSGTDGLAVMEAENFTTKNDRGGQSWTERSDITGFSGTAFLRVEADNNVNISTGYATTSPQVNFEVDFVKTGTHYVWIRTRNTGGGDNSLHVGLDGNAPTSGRNITFSGSANAWNWSHSSKTIDVSSTGTHTFNIWMREDGARIDKIVLTTNPNYVPSGNGPGETTGSRIANGAIKEIAESLLAIYPNPSNGHIVIQSLKRGEVQIYNSTGAKVGKLYLNEGDNKIDLSHLKVGIYFLQSISGGADSQVTRLIISE